jgi:hypothetical protein
VYLRVPYAFNDILSTLKKKKKLATTTWHVSVFVPKALYSLFIYFLVKEMEREGKIVEGREEGKTS